jgi:DNA-directed RNA polymerase sigma subunit (sigma70/sigma32)
MTSRHHHSAKTDRNAAVIAAREAGATFAELGTRFSISPERARQIVVRAMWRGMRRPRISE